MIAFAHALTFPSRTLLMHEPVHRRELKVARFLKASMNFKENSIFFSGKGGGAQSKKPQSVGEV